MKKVFILLGVILLSFTLVSCKEEIKYEYYENSESLNREILRINYKWTDTHTSSIDLTNIDENLENGKLFQTHIGEDVKNYYLCGYLDEKFKKQFEKNNYFDEYSCAAYLGDGNYLMNWYEGINEEEYTYEECPIYWYKIPKDNKIPEKIKTKFLIIVLESVNLIYESVYSDERYELEMLFENRNFYNAKVEFNRDEAMLKGYNLQIVFNDEKINDNEFMIADTYYYKRICSSLLMKYFDEIPYVYLGSNTIYHDEELKDRYEYVKDEKGMVYFKLSDILELIGR